MEEWEPNDIREALRIPKQRMEYLKLKVGITADIEESDTPGRANKYSFRNAVQFAIAEELNRQGVKFEDIKKVLLILDREQVECNIFPSGLRPEHTMEDALSDFFVAEKSLQFFIIIEPYTESWHPVNITVLPTERDMTAYVSKLSKVSTIINPIRIRDTMIDYWKTRDREESLRKAGITSRQLLREETEAFLKKIEDEGV